MAKRKSRFSKFLGALTGTPYDKLLKQVENDDLKHKKVPPEIRKQIQQKRGQLTWTQKDLAQRCNFQVSIINDIETGKANYNPQHITKIKRILNI